MLVVLFLFDFKFSLAPSMTALSMAISRLLIVRRQWRYHQSIDHKELYDHFKRFITNLFGSKDIWIPIWHYLRRLWRRVRHRWQRRSVWGPHPAANSLPFEWYDHGQCSRRIRYCCGGRELASDEIQGVATSSSSTAISRSSSRFHYHTMHGKHRQCMH